MKKIAFAGAGLSCAVIANQLAKAGYLVTVFESRSHVAGNCYTETDEETGVMLHRYGPHIFHTNDEEVWDFVNELTEFKPYVNKVKIMANDAVYSLPINLHTINQFFNKTFNPTEARAFIDSIADKSIKHPVNFEEQALRFLGKEFYEAFFKGYTLKQWGVDPKRLPASILKRLPVRFNYDDNYFSHQYQGIPTEGYTVLVDKLLSHENITLHLNRKFLSEMSDSFEHVFFSGPLDSYFNYRLGRLSYRTLDFKKEVHQGDYQGIAVMNYGDFDVPYTRITEHKHFSPWKSHDKTVIYKEFSRSCNEEDIPYYPVKLEGQNTLLKQYIALANRCSGVSFVGRLGTYQYIDMDVTLRKAIDIAAKTIQLLERKQKIPAFFEAL